MDTNNDARKRRRKAYSELTFTDDFMFRKILRNNSKLCSDLIELLLDVKVKSINYRDDDHSIAPSPEAKSVRLDVYLDDEEGTVFDLEMQNLESECLPRRVRYYQSMIDIEHIDAGDPYSSLPDSYIVFICMFDPYNRGLHKYEFKEICRQDHEIELGDGTSKVFINALSKEPDMSDDMRAFLDYLCGEAAASDMTREIDSDIARARASKPWEVEYMQWDEIMSRERKVGLEEGIVVGRKEGREEGIIVGREEGMYKAIDRLVADGVYDAKRACDLLGVDIDAYNKHLADVKTDE